MSLSSEDRILVRNLAHEIRDVQRRTNELLVEIRDLLKSGPVNISGKAIPVPACTCGESKAPCPVHGA